MRVVGYMADVWGCGWFRLALAARVLVAQGHDVHLIAPGVDHKDYGVTGDMRDDVMVDAHIPFDADVVVMQRVSHRRLAQAVPLLRKKGVTVVIDVDDDLQHIHPANPAFAMLHPRTQGKGVTDMAWRWCYDACRDASMVTVSTPALLPRYAPHGRGRVLPNCIPDAYLTVDHEDSDLIGWGGTVRSHPDDLQAMGGAFRGLAEEGHRFHVAGPKDGVADALGVPDGAVLGTGTLAIQVWPVVLAKLGIGLVPLSDTRFNSSKSWLKGIEQSALGVPWIASPRPEYRRLHKQAPGAGLLAEKPQDWARHMRTLARDPLRRREMSAAGRELAERWTVETNAWRWAEAWADAWREDHQFRPARTPLGLPA